MNFQSYVIDQLLPFLLFAILILPAFRLWQYYTKTRHVDYLVFLVMVILALLLLVWTLLTPIFPDSERVLQLGTGISLSLFFYALLILGLLIKWQQLSRLQHLLVHSSGVISIILSIVTILGEEPLITRVDLINAFYFLIIAVVLLIIVLRVRPVEDGSRVIFAQRVWVVISLSFVVAQFSWIMAANELIFLAVGVLALFVLAGLFPEGLIYSKSQIMRLFGLYQFVEQPKVVDEEQQQQDLDSYLDLIREKYGDLDQSND